MKGKVKKEFGKGDENASEKGGEDEGG